MTALITETESTTRGSCPSPSPMCTLQELLDLPALDPTVVALCRERATGLSVRITRRIRAEVAAFATTTDPDIEDAIAEAITCAVEAFMDALAQRPVGIESVLTYYQALGALQAQIGHDLDAMQAAHQIATQESWDELQHMTTAMGLPAEVVARAGHAVMTYQRLLLDQAVAGHAAARTEQPVDRREASARLLVELMTSNRPERVAALAAECEWPVPSRIAVVTAHVAVDADLGPALAPHPFALAGIRRGRLVVIVDADDAADLARLLADRAAGPVAVTWGVPTHDVHHAVRWAARTLALAGQGIIEVPDDGLLWCRDHQAHLCLHADPALRRHADEELLAPLLLEKPKRRCALAETMLLWLQSRPSAPALAAQLGVHDQTVRHRMRHLKQMFSEELIDPARTLGLLTALESATPRWRRDAA